MKQSPKRIDDQENFGDEINTFEYVDESETDGLEDFDYLPVYFQGGW